MSTSGEPGDRLEGDVQERVDEEDMATRLTRGVVDGFTEASEAFSHELAGTNRLPDLMGRSVAGVIRANARLLDELATLTRQMSDEFSVRPRVAIGNELDYEHLADLVAARLSSAETAGAAAEPTPPSGRSRKA